MVFPTFPSDFVLRSPAPPYFRIVPTPQKSIVVIPPAHPVPPPPISCALPHCTLETPHLAGGVPHLCSRGTERRFFSLLSDGNSWSIESGQLGVRSGPSFASTRCLEEFVISMHGPEVFTSVPIQFASGWALTCASYELSHHTL